MAASELRAEYASAGPSDATLFVVVVVATLRAVVGLVGVVVVVLGVVVLVVVMATDP